MNLAGVIREAEKLQRGAGISDYTRMYKKMLRTLKVLSTRIEVYDGVMRE